MCWKVTLEKAKLILGFPQNVHTDYAQPPLSDSYPGVLNTGSRLYNHPALNGQLPEPWLPILAEPTGLADVPQVVSDAVRGGGAVIVDLRRRWSIAKRAVRKGANAVPGINLPRSSSDRSMDEATREATNAWRYRSGSEASEGGAASGGSNGGGQETMIDHADVGESEGGESSDELEDEGEGMSRYSTYWHHKDGQTFPPARVGEASDTEDES